MGFRWLLGFSQVARGLGDHFATTVSNLWASCALSVSNFYASIYSNAVSSAFWCFCAEKSLEGSYYLFP